MEVVFAETIPSVNFRRVKVSASEPLAVTLTGTDIVWGKPYNKDDLVLAIVVT
jgi:hypothetical protein